MVSENQYIAKGIYRHSQIGKFVSVKNYIFLRERDGKRLLLRFSNELGYAVDGMAYTVFQYDALGNPLGRAEVSHSGVDLLPGETYAPDAAVAVDERCVDFKVVFSEVRSGRYRYQVKDQVVSVSYTGNEKERLESAETALGESAAPDQGYSVRKKTFAHGRLAAFAAVLAILLLIGLNIAQIFFACQRGLRKEREESADGGVHAQYQVFAEKVIASGERNVEI